MTRHHLPSTLLVLVGTALLVGCGTVDLDACLPYCEGQQGYVCDEGELIPAQLCGAGESCQQGACVPHTGDDAANGADGASSPTGDGAQTGPDGVTTCTARCEGKSSDQGASEHFISRGPYKSVSRNTQGLSRAK